MIVTVRKISPISMAKVLCCLHAVVGLMVGAIITVVTLFKGEEAGPGVGVWSIILIPLFNAVLGVLAGLFIAGCYNACASWLGGVKFEFEQE